MLFRLAPKQFCLLSVLSHNYQTMNSFDHFFTEGLLRSRNRIASEGSKTVRLDKNELPFDVADDVKKMVLEYVFKQQWNRYPAANPVEVETLIAASLGLSSDNIVVAPGAANIIVSLLSYFSLAGKSITIVQPSYALFDYYCKTYGIDYQPWFLNRDLEYDLSTFPSQLSQSVVFIASPNNPVGNVIGSSDLEWLLQHHQQTIFVVDEVYCDFSGTDFKRLIFRYDNIVLLRSLSKTMSSAGIRIGYLICRPEVAEQIRKLILSFSLNYLSIAFVKVVLSNDKLMTEMKDRVKAIVDERDRLYLRLIDLAPTRFFVKWSLGNFLLVRFASEADHYLLLDLLHHHGVSVLDVSNLCLLEHSLRIGVGNAHENDLLVKVFENAFG